MLKISKLRFIMRSAAATLAVALAAVGSVGATTIGTNISTDGTLTVAGASTLQAAVGITSTTNPQLTVKYDTTNYMTQGVSATGVVTFTRYGSALQKGFTLASTVAIASSTLETLLTVESSSSSNASTTLAVYQFGTGDILNLYDAGTAVFTVKDGGTIGVASSTPFGLLAVEQSTETNSFIVSNTGSSTPSFVVKGVNGDGRVGIGTLSPSSTLHLLSSTSNPQLTFAYDANNYWTQGVGSTGVVTFTRYGSALQKGFTLADTVAIASSTLQTLLTVESSSSSNASTTLAVYQFGTGDILNLYDSGTAVFTVKDGGKIGVGSSTPHALFSVAALTGQNAFIVGSSSVELFKIDSSGAVSFNGGGWSTADLTIQGDTVNNLVTVDASVDSVGIASSTPWGLLAVEQSTEARSLVVMNQGSSTPSFIINGVNGDGRVGVATSSPYATFSVGQSNATTTPMFAVGNSTATTTIDLGKVCFRSVSDGGTTIFWYFTTGKNGSAAINIATSTTSCF